MAEWVRAAARAFEQAGLREPQREAAMLLGTVLSTDRGGVLARGPELLDAERAARFASLVERRRRREPAAYLEGGCEFYGLRFAVDARVLIPRPETEGLVTALLERLPHSPCRVADLGTGSGCIAVSIAVTRPDVSLGALDRSEGALEVARRNAAAHGVTERIDFRRGDFASPPPDWVGLMNAVASNPPYVSQAEWLALEPEVRDHEPREALVPGESGLEGYEALAPAAFRLLRPGGSLVLELGHRSEAGARAVVAAAGFDAIEVRPDLRGIPRVLLARRREP